MKKHHYLRVITIGLIAAALLGGLTLGFIYEIVFSKILFGPEGLIHIEALCYMTQDSTKNLFALAFLAVCGRWLDI